jgi:hypothetical protein
MQDDANGGVIFFGSCYSMILELWEKPNEP